MNVDKETLHQLARQICPINPSGDPLGGGMTLKVNALAQKIIDLTAEKDGGEVLIEVVG